MSFRSPLVRCGVFELFLVAVFLVDAHGQVPAELDRWLKPQDWTRDTEGPILSLGVDGTFDDKHIFAPTVAHDGDQFLLWYCGSSGFAHDLSEERTVDERVFQLGLATSRDGKHFERRTHPVMALDDAKRSILTPCVLKSADGSILRESGQLRMWFSTATLGGGGRPHSLQEATSPDGVQWSPPSTVELDKAYAPAVLKTNRGYQLWYTEPGAYPWSIKYAESGDGRRWEVREQPVLVVSQAWEHDLQIYPAVIKVDDVYLLWYASYATADHQTTAIGFAASLDGITWYKHPQNPVLQPDPTRPWESYYVSSHSVMRLEDGRFRIWYASRKEPPFKNLYFAINTATWAGPETK